MRVELIGDLIEQEDGSAIAQIDVDKEGKMYLMEQGLEYILLKGIGKIKRQGLKDKIEYYGGYHD